MGNEATRNAWAKYTLGGASLVTPPGRTASEVWQHGKAVIGRSRGLHSAVDTGHLRYYACEATDRTYILNMARKRVNIPRK